MNLRDRRHVATGARRCGTAGLLRDDAGPPSVGAEEQRTAPRLRDTRAPLPVYRPQDRRELVAVNRSSASKRRPHWWCRLDRSGCSPRSSTQGSALTKRSIAFDRIAYLAFFAPGRSTLHSSHGVPPGQRCRAAGFQTPPWRREVPAGQPDFHEDGLYRASALPGAVFLLALPRRSASQPTRGGTQQRLAAIVSNAV